MVNRRILTTSPPLRACLCPRHQQKLNTMPTRLDSSHSAEELTKVSDANSEQTVRKSTTASPNQVAETVTTSMSTPTGSSTKTERSVAASASATREYGQQKTIFHANRIVWYLFAFIEIVLAFRFVLKLLGANPDAGFTKFVYSLSTPFAGPFLNIFRASTNAGAETTSYFEWSTLVAAIVYIVLTWAIIKLFKLGKPTDPNEVAQSVNNQ